MLDVIIPVHNGAEVIGATISALQRQKGVEDGACHIIVVDDGSSDDTAEVVRAATGAPVVLVSLSQRGGRARACNAGVAASTADVLLFLDADCMPVGDDLLLRHKRVLQQGYDVSFGPVTAEGAGFWERYARTVAADRERRVRSGDYLALTSCNLAVRRRAFENAGGFHEGYRHYGFEDRDLIAALLALGACCHFEREAAVLHDSRAIVAQICRKMNEAGRFSARVFQQRQPELYRSMGYAQLDFRTAGLLVRASAWLLVPTGTVLKTVSEPLVTMRWLPYRLRVWLVRGSAGLAYLKGSRAGEADERSSPR